MTEFSRWVEARLAEQEREHVNPRQLETGRRLLVALEIWAKEMNVYTSHISREAALYERERRFAYEIMLLTGLFLVCILPLARHISGLTPAFFLALILLCAMSKGWEHKTRLKHASNADERLEERIAKARSGRGEQAD